MVLERLDSYVQKDQTTSSHCESEVAKSSPALCNPMDCSLPCSSIHGIFQARILEWGAKTAPKYIPIFMGPKGYIFDYNLRVSNQLYEN